MRLRRKTGTKEWLAEHDRLIVLDGRQRRGEWSRIAGGKPIHAELGMGKGTFISEMSARHPDIHYIGIDRYDELLRRGGEKAYEVHAAAGRGEPDNLSLVLFNIEYIDELFAPGELERIYLNFSDPWPKKRHAERRLTHPRFLRKYMEILNDRGEIYLRTDSKSLFEFSLNSFADTGLRMADITFDLHAGGLPEGHVMTEYEAKFSKQGMPIYQCRVIVGRKALEEHEARLRAMESANARRAARTPAQEATVEADK
jgi:tRNA (guanine-N7-)-methyltransferase